MINAFGAIIFLALAIAAVSMTITKSRVFSGFRGWTKKNLKFVSGLFECPYCIAHWFALAAAWVYKPIIVTSGLVAVDIIVAMFSLVAVSSIFCGVIYWAFKGMKIESAEVEDDEPEKDVDKEDEAEYRIDEEEDDKAEEGSVTERADRAIAEADKTLRRLRKRSAPLTEPDDESLNREPIVHGEAIPKTEVPKTKPKHIKPAKPPKTEAPKAEVAKPVTAKEEKPEEKPAEPVATGGATT